jgi:hypothetical protein
MPARWMFRPVFHDLFEHPGMPTLLEYRYKPFARQILAENTFSMLIMATVCVLLAQ